MLALVAFGSFAVWALLIGSDRFMWDRYLLPGTMAAALLLLHLGNELRAGSKVPARTKRFAAVALGGLVVLSLTMTISDDGSTGGQWRYSDRFAATVPLTATSLIYTDWTWSSMQGREYIYDNLVYAPCYVENVNQREPTRRSRLYTEWQLARPLHLLNV